MIFEVLKFSLHNGTFQLGKLFILNCSSTQLNFLSSTQLFESFKLMLSLNNYMIMLRFRLNVLFDILLNVNWFNKFESIKSQPKYIEYQFVTLFEYKYSSIVWNCQRWSVLLHCYFEIISLLHNSFQVVDIHFVVSQVNIDQRSYGTSELLLFTYRCLEVITFLLHFVQVNLSLMWIRHHKQILSGMILFALYHIDQPMRRMIGHW